MIRNVYFFIFEDICKKVSVSIKFYSTQKEEKKEKNFIYRNKHLSFKNPSEFGDHSVTSMQYFLNKAGNF